jgi:hypothetical protein
LHTGGAQTAMNFPNFVAGESGSFWAPTLVLIGLYAVRYGVFAGFAYALGYRRGRSDRWHKLQPSMPTAAQLRREIAYSVVAVAVFGLINVVLGVLGALPHTLLYTDIARHGWMWFVLSIPVALLLHDAYFYWTHRLLHRRVIFGIVHRVHHLSMNPTPWTAYSFHPMESLVQADPPVGADRLPDGFDGSERLRALRIRAIPAVLVATLAGTLDQHVGRPQHAPRDSAPQLRALFPVLGSVDGYAGSGLRP